MVQEEGGPRHRLGLDGQLGVHGRHEPGHHRRHRICGLEERVPGARCRLGPRSHTVYRVHHPVQARG